MAGAGSWGTALALVLARNQCRTYLWERTAARAEQLQEERCNNRYLPGHSFPESLTVVSDLAPLPPAVRRVVVATPCAGLAETLERLPSPLPDNFSLCLACKGIDPDTLRLNHLATEERLPGAAVAVLSGPSFARETAAGLPTAVTIAARAPATADDFSRLFHCDVFRAYTSDDLVGVQVGGAVKNVIAIAAGIVDGLQYGANTRAALITRGLAEIKRLGLAMGARADTFLGLAGVGDLALTCADDQSRNRRFGMALARGLAPAAAAAEIGQVVEGMHTARVVGALAQKHAVDMPISEQVLGVIEGDVAPDQAVRRLLAREPRNETA